MRIIYSFCLVFISVFLCTAQDITISLDEIGFSNPLEKQYLQEVSNGDYNHIIEAFYFSGIAYDSLKAQQYVATISKGIEEFKASKAFDTKPKKQIKTCYSTVHDTYFKKYQENVFFNQIFDHGRFNCVTGTALYAIYFDRLGIPFEVREGVNHVYLVAYPKDDEILVESTNPAKGYVAFPDIYKEAFVNYLNEGKIISDEEKLTNTRDDLFNKYFYREKSVSLKELLSFQYLNSALLLKQNNGSFREMLPYIEKGLYLYPSERFSFNYMSVLAEIMNTYDKANPDDIPYFIKHAKFIGCGISKDQYVNNYGVIASTLLMETGQKQVYDSMYVQFQHINIDTETLVEIKLLNHQLLATYFLSKGLTDEGLRHAIKAYALKPENINIQNQVCEVLGSKLNTMSRVEALQLVDSVSQVNKAIQKNNYYTSMRAEVLLLNALTSFEMNSLKIGNQYLVNFEALYDNGKCNLISTELIGNVYTAKAIAYFRKGQKSYARTVIEKGLEYAPYSSRLQQSKQMF